MSGRIDEFEKRNCQVLAISTDSIETHVQWLSASPQQSGLGPIRFPLGSDFGGDVCQKYSVYDKRRDMALRGLFLIDDNGVLQYQVTHNLNVGRSTDEVLRVLDAVQSGGLCPAEKTASESLQVPEVIGTGQVIGNYRVKSELGRGSFGTVFLAQDRMLRRPVALKVLKENHRGRVRSLVSEARVAATLNHPSFCNVHAIEQVGNNSMIVMEYIEGQTLNDRIAVEQQMDPSLVAKVTLQLAEAMAAAHKKGVVHGDLKPANVMLGEDEAIKIMDFGLARVTRQDTSLGDETLDRSWTSDTSQVGQASTALGSGITGTPRYMSPELIQGKPASMISDVFALGLIVYEMVTGKAAINGMTLLDVIRQIGSIDGDKLAAELPEPLDHVIRNSLVGESEEANQITMGEIAQHLLSTADTWKLPSSVSDAVQN